MNDCLFCRIAEGLIPTHKIHEDADTVAFFDLNPQAPTHALVIPRKHIQSFTALSPQDGNILAAMAQTVNQVVLLQGLGGGFRVVCNNGADAGQSVPHLHWHVLGGRPLAWPPG